MASPPENPELRGLRAAVLGSTSGIGRAVALELARAGADVLIHGRSSRDAAERVAEEVRRLGGRSTSSWPTWPTATAGDRLVDEAWDVWDGLDAWLQIAGADTLTGDAARLDFDAKLDRLWAVDVVATIRLTPRGRPEDEGARRRLDRDDGLGPGRVGHGRGLGRALRRHQGGDHGLHRGASP